jgi:hypothetical protein
MWSVAIGLLRPGPGVRDRRNTSSAQRLLLAGAAMTEPRELSYLVPVDPLAEVNTAVTVLETYGPVVTKALRSWIGRPRWPGRR